MSSVADPIGAPYFKIFSPAAIARRASLCPIGRSAGNTTGSPATITVSSRADPGRGDENIVPCVEKKQPPVGVAAHVNR